MFVETKPSGLRILFVQVQCGDAEVEKKIEEKIDEFINKVEKHPNRKSQVCVLFN